MSTMNTTENGMWENERPVCETKNNCKKNKKNINLNLPGVVNAADYLPQFVSRRYGDIVPILTDSCNLNVKFNPKSNTIKYRYSVSWYEDGPIHKPIAYSTDKKSNKNDERGEPRLDCPKAKHRQKIDMKNSLKDVVDMVNTGTKPMKRSSQEVSVELIHEATHPEVRICDGPCGQMRNVSDLRVLGRCDHAVCAYCIVNAPMLPQDDGTMGCCNKRCFATDLVNRVPERKRRHELYQLIFKNKSLDEIYKLYDDDIRRLSISDDMSKMKFTASSSPTSENYSLTSESSLYDTTTTKPTTTFTDSSKLSSSGITTSTTNVNTSSVESSTINSDTRTMDFNYPTEAVLFRLVALDSGYHSTIKRHRFEVELPFTVKLIDAIKELLGEQIKKRINDDLVRIFYNPDGKTDSFVDSTRLYELIPNEHGYLSISKFLSGGYINIIIDFTGKVIKGKRPLFKI